METPIVKRNQKFMGKYFQSDNALCQLFAHVKTGYTLSSWKYVTCGYLDIICFITFFFLFIVFNYFLIAAN